MNGNKGSTKAFACSVLVNCAKPNPFDAPCRKSQEEEYVNQREGSRRRMGQVPVDLSRIIVTDSMLQLLLAR